MILMNSCFVSSLIIDCIFITFDFTAIQRGVYFLLPTTVYIYIYIYKKQIIYFRLEFLDETIVPSVIRKVIILCCFRFSCVHLSYDLISCFWDFQF